MGQLRTDAPPVLYKFRSNVGRDVPCLLERRQLYCASPLELNDPFDCYPVLAIPPAAERAALIEAEVAAAPPGLADEARRRCHLLCTSPVHRERFLEEFYTRDFGRLGVVSLSVPRDNPLLWAHYAGNFAGFAVGYRARDEPSREALGTAPVTYGERPRMWPFGDDEAETWLRVIFTKSDDWGYEQEWRYVRMIDDGGRGMMPVPDGCIVEVCLGPRMKKEDRATVIAVARALPDKPAILQVTRMPDRFGLAFEPI